MAASTSRIFRNLPLSLTGVIGEESIEVPELLNVAADELLESIGAGVDDVEPGVGKAASEATGAPLLEEREVVRVNPELLLMNTLMSPDAIAARIDSGTSWSICFPINSTNFSAKWLSTKSWLAAFRGVAEGSEEWMSKLPSGCFST